MAAGSSRVTTGKNACIARAKLSTTNAPPNISRLVPSAISVITGISEASTPSDAMRGTSARARSGQIRSTTSATRIVAVSTSSGAIAWKSTCGFTPGPWSVHVRAR
jgi:hypothetical protein